MILTDRTDEWRRRRERYERAFHPERVGVHVREDPPMIPVVFWNPPEGYRRKRPFEAQEWDELLAEELPVKQVQELLGKSIAKVVQK